MCIVPFAVFLKKNRHYLIFDADKREAYCSGKKVRREDITLNLPAHPVLFSLLVIGSLFVVNIAASNFENLFNPVQNPQIFLPTSVIGILLVFLSTAVLPALFEEWIFRGIVLRSLLPYNRYFAIIASAILFGVMHNDAGQMFSATVFGILVGFAYVSSGSLFIGVVLHFINNAFSVYNSYAYAFSESGSMAQYFSDIWVIGFMLLAICSAIIMLFVKTTAFRIDDKNHGNYPELSMEKVAVSVIATKTVYVFMGILIVFRIFAKIW
jgi:membrane protease YdiL (CAAX protease family)